MSKVTNITKDFIHFDDGSTLSSDHCQDCCENHYLDFKQLDIEDFRGLEFDLSTDNFFEKVKGFGIRLIPVHGHPIPVPGYGYNNGYYSSDLEFVINHQGNARSIDISDCQDISG